MGIKNNSFLGRVQSTEQVPEVEGFTWGHKSVVALAMLEEWLDWVILEAFSSLRFPIVLSKPFGKARFKNK